MEQYALKIDYNSAIIKCIFSQNCSGMNRIAPNEADKKNMM